MTISRHVIIFHQKQKRCHAHEHCKFYRTVILVLRRRTPTSTSTVRAPGSMAVLRLKVYSVQTATIHWPYGKLHFRSHWRMLPWTRKKGFPKKSSKGVLSYTLTKFNDGAAQCSSPWTHFKWAIYITLILVWKYNKDSTKWWIHGLNGL